MTKTIEAKAVREARAEARRMARKTELTYQQALDQVARNAGSDHWAAFIALHPPGLAPATADANNDEVRPRRREDRETLSGYVRSVITGEHGATEDRIRSAMVIGEAEDFVTDLPADADGFVKVDKQRVRRNLWLSVAKNIVTAPVVILVTGCLYATANAFTPNIDGLRYGDVASTAAYAFIPGILLFLACLAIGDQPGMERRRAMAWTVMLWMQIVGAAIFALNAFDGFYNLLHSVTGLKRETALACGIGSIIVGSTLKEAMHALMALGAALGPKGDGSSIADQNAVAYAIERKRMDEKENAKDLPRPQPLTPKMAREMGAPRTWWRRIDPLSVMLAMTGAGCLLAFGGVGLQFFLNVNAMPIAYAGLAMLAPVMLAIFVGMIALTGYGLISLPGMVRRRMRTHRLVKEHERTRQV